MNKRSWHDLDIDEMSLFSIFENESQDAKIPRVESVGAISSSAPGQGDPVCCDSQWSLICDEVDRRCGSSLERRSSLSLSGITEEPHVPDCCDLGTVCDLSVSTLGSFSFILSQQGSGFDGRSQPNLNGDGLLPQAGVGGEVPADECDELAQFGDVLQNTTAGNFRFQGTVFHLTYRGHHTPDRLFKLFSGESRFKWYSIVHEIGTHKGEGSEAYAHTHFYGHLHDRISRQGARCFDIEGADGHLVHPFIQKITSKVHEGRLYHVYHRKAPIQIWQSKEGPPDPALSSGKDRIESLLHGGSLLDAVLGFGAEIKSVSDINLLRNERKPAEPATSRYPLDTFNFHICWSHSYNGKIFDTCSVFLYGGAGLGKTECAIAHFERPLLVRGLDACRDFNPIRYDGIVFDDCAIGHLSAEYRIHLADFTQRTSVHCRFKDAEIPPFVKRIFTSNKTPEEYWRGGTHMTDDQYEGIKRRVKFIHIRSSTY